MTTTPLVSPVQGTQVPGTTQSTAGTYNLKPADFIKMMVTQLQNQDPLQPASNQELLQQMSQIGQLQSSTDLTTSLKGMVLQNQIGAAGNLIGKTVQGTDDQKNMVQGVVDSVRVQTDGVYLQLHSGKQIAMGNVTAIAATPATTSVPAA